jgi:hypothetical protein
MYREMQISVGANLQVRLATEVASPAAPGSCRNVFHQCPRLEKATGAAGGIFVDSVKAHTRIIIAIEVQTTIASFASGRLPHESREMALPIKMVKIFLKLSEIVLRHRPIRI